MIFLANENFPKAAFLLLRERQHIVHSVLEEFPGADDPFVMNLARERNAVILTFDKDYGELIYHRKLPVPPGVIFFRFDPITPLEPATLILEYLKQPEINFDNLFTVIGRESLRQRELPDN